MADNQELSKNEKISVAMKGNSNAEKWTEEVVLELLETMFKAIREQNIYYLGSLLDDFDLSPDWWGDMSEKFKGTKTVIRAIKRCEQRLEKTLVNAMLTNKVKETTGIFTLKSKYKWIEKSQVDHKHAVDPIQISINLKD